MEGTKFRGVQAEFMQAVVAELKAIRIALEAHSPHTQTPEPVPEQRNVPTAPVVEKKPEPTVAEKPAARRTASRTKSKE